MITFPAGFIAIRYPGYFFHPASNQLYSIKISGELKPLARTKYWDRYGRNSGLIHGEAGYTVSCKGKRHFMPLRDLKTLRPNAYEIPIHAQEKN